MQNYKEELEKQIQEIDALITRIDKNESYEQSGYFPGKNMIMTFETSQHAISSNIIKAMIEE